MAKRTDAYVDTSALIAFADRSDSYHRLFRRLFSEPPHLITSTLVIAEGYGWFLRRYDQTRALQFISFIENLKPLQVIAVGNSELSEGYRTLRRLSDQGLTLVDAVSLHLLTATKVHVCWTTDFHLGLTGVPLIIHKA